MSRALTMGIFGIQGLEVFLELEGRVKLHLASAGLSSITSIIVPESMALEVDL